MAFTPTDEQAHAVEIAKLGESMAIEALAGAGKTSTLKLVAEALPGRGAYVAFNKKIVTEAQERFPSSVACSTAHSLAFRAVGKNYRDRLNSGRVTARQAADALGLDLNTNVVFDRDDHVVEMTAERIASIALETVNVFCRVADRFITRTHVPFQKGLDEPNQWENNRRLAERVVPLAERIWQELQDPNGGRFRFEHNHYLKMWQLSGPRIHADYILFDEAQDANPLMMAIVEGQNHAQRIWVGDSNQSIYEWNGAVDALQRVTVENRARLTQSFRFGPEIAAQANVVLDRLDAGVQVIGAGRPGSVGVIDRPDVWLGRTNGAVIGTALMLMDRGQRVCVQGGTREVIWFAESAQALMAGAKASHPDLACFTNWDQVLRYVEEEKEQGGGLKTLVKLVQDYGAEQIIHGLSRTVEPRFADVTVSTAHKAKGAEWNRVALLGDYQDQDPTPAELKLLYVAVTRAMVELDRSAVDLEGPAEDESLEADVEDTPFDMFG